MEGALGSGLLNHPCRISLVSLNTLLEADLAKEALEVGGTWPKLLLSPQLLKLIFLQL